LNTAGLYIGGLLVETKMSILTLIFGVEVRKEVSTFRRKYDMSRERRLANYKPGTYGNCAVLILDYDPHGFGETLEYEGFIATITPSWTTLTFADGETLRLSTKRNKRPALP
jgi:hypothetical protein